MSKLFKYFKHLILAAFLIPITISNIYLYKPQFNTFEKDKSIVRDQLNYLDLIIIGKGPEKMQELYPEGAFFLYALYSLSWIQYANRFDKINDESQQALKKASFGIQKMDDELSRFKYLKDLNPKYGIFMSGWINWAKGSYILVCKKLEVEEDYESDFKEGCKRISNAFKQSKSHYLESYHGKAWPSDNIVAIASLKLYDKIYEEEHVKLINDWLSKVKSTLDENSGMFPYESNYENGTSIDGAHGNSQAVIIRFLSELDKDFAIEQYKLYNINFQKKMLGLNLTKEKPGDMASESNVDSGPVILGIGSAATIVSQIPYRIFKDKEHVDKILASINALGIPITYKNQTKYAFGLMPIADAFLVWGSLTKPYTQNYDRLVLNETNIFWRLEFHLYSLLLILFISLLLYPEKLLNFKIKNIKI